MPRGFINKSFLSKGRVQVNMIDSHSSENEQENVQRFQEKYLYTIGQRTDKLENQKNNKLTECQRENLQLIQSLSEQSKPIIVIDGVIFQINQGGIARVWYSILQGVTEGLQAR